MNERPYGEGLLCARSVIGHFQEQEVTALCITLTACALRRSCHVGDGYSGCVDLARTLPGSVGVSSELEGPSAGVASALLVPSVPSPGSCLRSPEWLPVTGSASPLLG